MQSWIVAAAILLPSVPVHADPLADQTQAIATEITQHGQAYATLSELTKIGPRLAASPNAEKAVQWAKAKLEALGFDHVTLQPMATPVWTRGDVERGTITDGADTVAVKVTALGTSVGTPSGGIEAEVVEVQGLADVDTLGDAVRGKIVFYNRPMEVLPDMFEAYGRAVDQRSGGAARAASHGAVASIVRSLTTLADDDHPHTGVMSKADIPGAAISIKGANELSRRLAANPHLKLKLELSAANHDPSTSYNVYADLTGSTHPDEIVSVGGHLDSWDLGVGAQDDGAGVVHAIEALRAIKALGLQPKRTLRVILYMTEEFGGYGGQAYADAAKTDGKTHVAAIESDCGGFAPLGFSTDAGANAVAKLQSWSKYLAPLGAGTMTEGDSGTDVGPMADAGATTIGFVPVSTHYFDYHHSALDQMAAVDRADLHAGAAAIAALAWLYAEDVP